eukprot:TRINITY_DN9776_c0_g1_i3.p1 TRINITY_DN9776_c0_g1~~TRINITY_DN9776_c0_g1_i3.p1  ORF type:complete len:1041 (-),score=175.63 TRINITY_DN9776_c0_g1_i3:159-3170(-)
MQVPEVPSLFEDLLRRLGDEHLRELEMLRAELRKLILSNGLEADFSNPAIFGGPQLVTDICRKRLEDLRGMYTQEDSKVVALPPTTWKATPFSGTFPSGLSDYTDDFDGDPAFASPCTPLASTVGTTSARGGRVPLPPDIRLKNRLRKSFGKVSRNCTWHPSVSAEEDFPTLWDTGSLQGQAVGPPSHHEHGAGHDELLENVAVETKNILGIQPGSGRTSRTSKRAMTNDLSLMNGSYPLPPASETNEQEEFHVELGTPRHTIKGSPRQTMWKKGDEEPLNDGCLGSAETTAEANDENEEKNSEKFEDTEGLDAWERFLEGVRTKLEENNLPLGELNDTWTKATELEVEPLTTLLKQIACEPKQLDEEYADEAQTQAAGTSIYRAKSFTKQSQCARALALFLFLFSHLKPMHPNCGKRMLWDLVGVALLLHDLVMVPMVTTFALPLDYLSFLEVFDVISAVFWTMDMVVSFLTGYFTGEGFVELDKKKVAFHYLKTWFTLDMMIVTFDWGTMVMGLGTAGRYVRLGKNLSRVLRVLRLLRLFKLNTTAKEIMARINSEYVLTIIGLIKILLFMVVLNHYLACAWYGLSTSLQGRFPTWTKKAFSQNETPEDYIGSIDADDIDFVYAYATALHWSFTQFTPASMEVFPLNSYERLFNIVVIIMALVIFSSFVSSITSAMTHLRMINAQTMQRESAIRSYFSEYKISPGLASRIWHYLANHKAISAQRMRLEDVPGLLNLPQEIREELCYAVFTPLLSQHPLFREFARADPAGMRKLCKSAVREVSLKAGQSAFKETNDLTQMVFVVDGCVEYHTAHKGAAGNIKVAKGSWACELVLWGKKARMDGPLVASTGGAELLLLDAPELRRIIEVFIGEGQPSSSVSLLAQYGEFFINRYNTFLRKDDDSDPLLNDYEAIEDMILTAIRQQWGVTGTSFTGIAKISTIRQSMTMTRPSIRTGRQSQIGRQSEKGRQSERGRQSESGRQSERKDPKKSRGARESVSTPAA